MVWQTASPSPLSPLASPQSLGCVILCLLPCRQLGNPWIFRHSADVAVFFCLKHINPSVTSLLSRFHPPTLPVFLAATATSNYMCCILKLHLTQMWASHGSFWYPAQKALCHPNPPNVSCACACMHTLHPVSEDPWQYHAANKRPPVPVC